MIPSKNITQELEANVNLVPGNTGAAYDLPAYRHHGIITSCWKLNWWERLKILFGGRIWLNVWGGGHPPVRIDAEPPEELYDDWWDCV